MSRREECCPICGRAMPPKLVVSGPVRQRLVDIIANRPNGITSGELMDLVYADDVDGGPDCVGTVAALVFHANKQLAPQGYRITSSGGRGARYRLVKQNDGGVDGRP